MGLTPATHGLRPGMITFDRARNTEGEFAPQTDDTGPDPATMRAAYGPTSTRPNLLGKGLEGAASGAAGTSVAMLLAKKLRARVR